MEGAAFLRNVIATFPYKIHKVLTDNGMAFADLPKNRERSTRRFLGPHAFDRACREHGIEHRLTKPYHPWTNGQAERMNRTVKDATVKTFHYDDVESLKAHVISFVATYNFAKHLKAPKWKAPFQSICDAWKSNPSEPDSKSYCGLVVAGRRMSRKANASMNQACDEVIDASKSFARRRARFTTRRFARRSNASAKQ
jgi:transposase InsO family protein